MRSVRLPTRPFVVPLHHDGHVLVKRRSTHTLTRCNFFTASHIVEKVIGYMAVENIWLKVTKMNSAQMLLLRFTTCTQFSILYGRRSKDAIDAAPRVRPGACCASVSTFCSHTLPDVSSVPALVILYAIWDLLVISADASADPYIFRVISYQCPAQCLL